ncbi:D-aminoacylase [Clostridium sp. 'deep sea']|uniref:N-acyl-D-amino-acid deacylase family protein n=1 Tax=Clostridium sp. 'deep sea' TaxID=2779445 RepID=UPI001896531D|nr:D-aminoacylase [Clostridium sp. 'deep sea']QOR36472.1 D-aminoacylase [Clostridium sp. 'deep sea']
MYSYIIKNARLLDGAGNPWRYGDVAIKNDIIASIGDFSNAKAETVIDAKGLYLSPGFIDVHTHSGMVLYVDGRAHSHLLQGVTTNVLGQCGSFLAPVTDLRLQTSDKSQIDITWRTTNEFLTLLEEKDLSVNVVPVAGQAAIRQCVMGYNPNKPSNTEMNEMKELLKEAMESGCFGVSTGLIYTPSSYADTEELIELTKIIADYNGIYFSHIRGENDFVLEAVNEAIEIGKQANVPVQISHLKAMGRHMWGKSVDILNMIDKAREDGIEVTFDQYPFKASACGLSAVLPPWAHVGGASKMRERLADKEQRAKIKHDILQGVDKWISIHKGVGFDNILITHTFEDESLIGKTVAEIAKERNADEFETCFDILQSIEGRVSIVYFTICDEDLERIMKHPAMMVGSDTSARPIDGPLTAGMPHPRTYGSFARVLGEYVRDKQVLTLPEAIRKMTSASAFKLGLYDRGLLLPGKKADLVLFDANTVRTDVTYTNPKQFPVGIKKVFVNGVLSVDNSKHTGASAGVVIRRK